jgi:hypothetical protein
MAAFFAQAGDVVLEAVASDFQMSADLARAEKAARGSDPSKGFPVSSMDPEDLSSVKCATREVMVAAMRLPVVRFDELVGEPGERLAIRAFKTLGGVDFEIKKMGLDDKTPAGWIETSPVASEGAAEGWALDIQRTYNDRPFARLHHERMQEKLSKKFTETNADRATLGLDPLEFRPEPFVDSAPLMDDAQARAEARFVLGRSWVMNHEELLTEHSFKAAHGMARAAAFKVALGAAHDGLQASSAKSTEAASAAAKTQRRSPVDGPKIQAPYNKQTRLVR